MNEQIKELATKHLRLDYNGTSNSMSLIGLSEFAKAIMTLAINSEREACAKLCDQQADSAYWEGADICAEAIRARGEVK